MLDKYSAVCEVASGLIPREAGITGQRFSFLKTKLSMSFCLCHWCQTQPLLRSNRAGVRWLSQDLCTRREESPAQSKVGGIADKTSLDQLFVQYKCTVMDEINGHYLQLP